METAKGVLILSPSKPGFHRRHTTNMGKKKDMGTALIQLALVQELVLEAAKLWGHGGWDRWVPSGEKTVHGIGIHQITLEC